MMLTPKAIVTAHVLISTLAYGQRGAQESKTNVPSMPSTLGGGEVAPRTLRQGLFREPS
jgi:hypothetical protein